MSSELEKFSTKSKDIESDLSSINEAIKLNPNNIELITRKQELLSEAVENTSAKLRMLKSTQESVSKEFTDGNISESEYRDFQREIQNTENSLRELKSQLKNTSGELSDFGNKFKKASSELKSTGEDIKNVGEKMSVGITAPIAGIAALATEGTKELREDMAKLEINAQMAGASLDITKNALRDLNAITGETDSNIEALSNLLEAGFTDSGMQEAINSLSGAVIKFPDTLKIESLSDSLQETMATGKATGQFAEMLERMGIDLETFDKGLERANKRGTEQQYILDTLAKTGLSQVNQAYRENNQELIDNANAQHDLQQELAGLGEILQPIITDITKGIADLLKWFNGLDDGTKNFIITIAGIAAVVGPILIGFGQLMTGLGSIIGLFGGTAAAAGTAATATAAAGTAAAGASGAMGAFSGILTALTGPIGIAIAVITALAAAAYLIIKNWEPIKEFFGKLWEGIKDLFSKFVEWVKEIFLNFTPLGQIIKNWDGIKEFFSTLWEGVKEVFNTFWDWLQGVFFNFTPLGLLIKNWDTVKSYFSDLWNSIKDIFSKFWDWIKNLFLNYHPLGIITKNWGAIKDYFARMWESIKETATNVFDNIVETITSVFDFIKGLPKKMIEFGKNIMQGLIDGIKGMIGKIGEAIRGIADKITGGIKGALGINSPSKVMMEMGEYTGEGFIQGLKSTISEVSKQSQAMSNAAQINVPKTNYSGSNAPGNINGATGDTYITMNVNMSQIEDLIKFNQMIKNAKQTARAT